MAATDLQHACAAASRPEFLTPCGAWRCPQSLRCLRANGVSEHSFDLPVIGWLKGCPHFVDRRGVALLSLSPTTP